MICLTMLNHINIGAFATPGDSVKLIEIHELNEKKSSGETVGIVLSLAVIKGLVVIAALFLINYRFNVLVGATRPGCIASNCLCFTLV